MAFVNHDVISRLDEAVRGDKVLLTNVALVPGRRGPEYADWYNKSLSSLAIMLVDDNVAFCSASLDESAHSCVIFVLTERRVLVSTVSGIGSDPSADVIAIPRRTLRTVSLDTSYRIEDQDGRPWMGRSKVTLTYEDLNAPIVLEVDSHDRYDLKSKGPLRTLLDALGADL